MMLFKLNIFLPKIVISYEKGNFQNINILRKLVSK
jgi:hypothetical protein